MPSTKTSAPTKDAYFTDLRLDQTKQILISVLPGLRPIQVTNHATDEEEEEAIQANKDKTILDGGVSMHSCDELEHSAVSPNYFLTQSDSAFPWSQETVSVLSEQQEPKKQRMRDESRQQLHDSTLVGEDCPVHGFCDCVEMESSVSGNLAEEEVRQTENHRNKNNNIESDPLRNGGSVGNGESMDNGESVENDESVENGESVENDDESVSNGEREDLAVSPNYSLTQPDSALPWSQETVDTFLSEQQHQGQKNHADDDDAAVDDSRQQQQQQQLLHGCSVHDGFKGEECCSVGLSSLLSSSLPPVVVSKKRSRVLRAYRSPKKWRRTIRTRRLQSIALCSKANGI